MIVTKVHVHFATTDDAVMEKKLLSLLKKHGWNVAETAAEIGMSRQGLFRIIGQRAGLTEHMAEARKQQLLSKLK